MPVLPEPAHVADTSVSTADEFLDVLSPRARHWGESASQWIFRGQRNAEWKLLPSAMRRTLDDHHPFQRFGILDSPIMQERLRRQDGTPEWSVRIDRLNRMLEHFARELDHQGLTVPHDNPAVRRHQLTSYGSFPDRAAFPLMALAQHHGLPTLFLDWTRRAWIAAYFAAADAAAGLWQRRLTHPSPAENAAHLAVWALCRQTDRGERSSPPGDYEIYEAPASTNPNLRAQNGLFVWWSSEEDLALEDHVAWVVRRYDVHVNLRRFVLPLEQAPRLLRLLALEHIDGAAMFPGVDGVVRAMKERTLWDSSL